LHPVTNTCEDDFGGFGATAIDSLPTAIIFGDENVTVQILEFIAALDLRAVKGGTRIQVFEVTIRHFAAMISAWDLLHGPFSHMAKSPDLRHALYVHMVALGEYLSVLSTVQVAFLVNGLILQHVSQEKALKTL
jgi:mannosyl-oligosaccharide alpha-1,2-mannosidase